MVHPHDHATDGYIIITARALCLIMKHGTDMLPTGVCLGMSTGTASHRKEMVPDILRSILAVAMGSVVILTGSVVLFAASPAIPADPVFVLSSLEPVSVIANTILGVSIGAVGVSVVVSQVDWLLEGPSF